jgi:hypothetical protein
MTILHLKRFIVEKTGWCHTLTDQVEILCKGNVLRDELTMEFIWRIRWGNLKSLLVLEYALKENTDCAVEPDVNSETCRRGRKRRHRSRVEAEKSEEANGKKKMAAVPVDSNNSSSSEELNWIYDSDEKEKGSESLSSGQSKELLGSAGECAAQMSTGETQREGMLDDTA